MSKDPSQIPVIDTDVHPSVPPREVYAQMPKRWREYFGSLSLRDFTRPRDRQPFPGRSGIREDLIRPGEGPPGSDPVKSAVELFDNFGTDAAVLISLQAAVVNAWSDPESATVFTQAFNRFLLDRWVAVDSRYTLAATVSPLDPVKAAREIRGYADVPGVVCIYVPLLEQLLGHPHYRPILKAAASAQIPIVLHATGGEGTRVGAPTLSGTPNHYPEWKTVLTQPGQSNLNSLIFEGVFERFPDLKVIFAEQGFTWVGSTIWRMETNWREFRYAVPWVKKAPGEYVREHVRFTTQPMDDVDNLQHFRASVESMYGDETLVFSSDFPHYDNDNPRVVLSRLPPASRERVASTNALEIFGARLTSRLRTDPLKKSA